MKPDQLAAPRAPAVLLLALSLAALGGCATVDNPNPRDPWEGFNRGAYRFNEGLDRVLLKPVATLYRDMGKLKDLAPEESHALDRILDAGTIKAITLCRNSAAAVRPVRHTIRVEAVN